MIYQVVNILFTKIQGQLRSDLCDYSGTYIVVKGTITVEEDNDTKKGGKKVTLRIISHLDHAYQK